MNKKIDLYLEQDEIHKIIKEYFKIGKDIEMESDTNAGRTTFTYTTKDAILGNGVISELGEEKP
jgi:hypothetical protein